VRVAEADCAVRLPLRPDGTVDGAGPIALDAGAGAPAVLLLHGGGDTPQTLRYMAAHLHARGFTVRAPLLPGHGRAIREFSGVSADAWLAHARAELESLRATHEWVAVVGLSMGGAIAVRLAAALPDLPALCLVAPYLAMPAIVRHVARTAPLWGPFVPYVRATGGRRPSIADPEERARSLAYGWFTPAALRALAATVDRAAAALPQVTAPTLMAQSRDDNRIAPDEALRAFARLGAAEKQVVWVPGAHVVTVDLGRAQVFDAVERWLEAHGADVRLPSVAPRRSAGG
jgi:carboxylesterase